MTAEPFHRVTGLGIIRAREAEKTTRIDRDVEIWQSIVAEHLRDQADRIEASISTQVTFAEHRDYVTRQWAADPDPAARNRLAHMLGYTDQVKLLQVITRWQKRNRRAA